MPAFCPLCASDEWTEFESGPDGDQYAVCRNRREHGEDGFVWEPEPKVGHTARADGLGHELQIWDKLLECVPPDGAAHSYGEVEDAFFALFPDEAERLQSLYGHRWREGQRSTSTYSMSVYLSLRLRELAKEGHLQLSWGPAEGPWSYNGVISHWTALAGPTG